MSGTLLEGITPLASKPGHVLYDTRDDRREVYHLLARLPPRERLRWLKWACRQAVLPGSQVQPRVSRRTRALAEQARWDSAADNRLTLEVYYDLWHLDVSYQVDFAALLKGLEQAAKHPRRRDRYAGGAKERDGDRR